MKLHVTSLYAVDVNDYDDDENNNLAGRSSPGENVWSAAQTSIKIRVLLGGSLAPPPHPSYCPPPVYRTCFVEVTLTSLVQCPPVRQRFPLPVPSGLAVHHGAVVVMELFTTTFPLRLLLLLLRG